MADEREEAANVEEKEGTQPEEVIDEDDDLVAHQEWKWIAREPRRMASEITSTSSNAFTIIEEDHVVPKNFAVYNVGPHQKICSTFHGDGFSMYEFVFKDLGLRLPFSPLATDIFKFLKLAPSQLHPNAIAFVLAFQHLCEYKGVVPTRALFFRVFQLQRTTKEFGRKSWVSLKNRVSLFDMYSESIRGFKSRFYCVRPVTPTGKSTLYDWVVDKNVDGTVRKSGDGSDKLREKEKFPMSWTEEHFRTGPGAYLTSDSSLSVEERRGLKVFQEYVAGLEPAMLVTRTGEPVLDEEGNAQFVPRLINTKRLLECRTRAEVHEVLGR
jgi:hypothetical protein